MLAGRLKDVWLALPSVVPGLPICCRNLPSRENFRICASWLGGGGGAAGVAAAPAPAAPPRPAPPRPPPPRPAAGSGHPAAAIQTLPLASTAIPPGAWGQL